MKEQMTIAEQIKRFKKMKRDFFGEYYDPSMTLMENGDALIERNMQIEEMAKEICCICHAYKNCVNTTPCTMAYKEAEGLYKADYRKQSELTVELPCKVGDTVYRIAKHRGVWQVLPREVVSLTYQLDHLYRVVWGIFSTQHDMLSKTVFLTREEAEKALAKMKGGAE